MTFQQFDAFLFATGLTAPSAEDLLIAAEDELLLLEDSLLDYDDDFEGLPAPALLREVELLDDEIRF